MPTVSAMIAPTYVATRSQSQMPLWRSGGLKLPQLTVELTERCNNDCIHCCINRPADDTAARSREMSTATVKDVLDQAADLGCLQVRFTGGEPLLRPDFEELYLFSRRLGMQVLLFTNACLITPELADTLARIPPLVPIEITVYGMHQASCEAITRRRGSFAQFRRGVNLLLVKKIPFVVKSVVLPQNRHEMHEFEAWAKTLPGMTMPPAQALLLELRSRRDDAVKNQAIASLRLSPADVLQVLAGDDDQYHRDAARFAATFSPAPTTRLFGCGAGRSVCIDAYGVAQPCMGLRDPRLTVKLDQRPDFSQEGDCARDRSAATQAGCTLAEALDRFMALSEMRAGNPEYLRRCGRCVLKGFCEQCPAKSWSEHGALDTPVDYLCQVAHAQARHLGWLDSGEHGWQVADWRQRAAARQPWTIGQRAVVPAPVCP